MSTPIKAVEILPGRAAGSVRAPASKSYANRALLLAALAEGESVIHNPLQSDDTEAMTGALRDLGVDVRTADDAWIVRSSGRFNTPSEGINCRDSGTTLRFLTAASALFDEPITLTGSEQLRRRPIQPLLDTLEELGVFAGTDDGYPPVVVCGPLRPGPARVESSASSQYASALMMALGATGCPDAAVFADGLVSVPYALMTLQSMTTCGVKWKQADDEPNLFYPDPGGCYRATESTVEFDASSAGHLFSVIALSGGDACVLGAHRDTAQPDIRLLELLENGGSEARETAFGVTLKGRPFAAPGEVDMNDWPDMLSAVAVVAAFAEGETVIRNAAHTRGHETDRIAATVRELNKMGVSAVETDDGLRIIGGQPHGAIIETYGDHRMAMAFAAAGCAVPGVVITDPDCVRKTYPDFWNDLKRLGIEWREVAI
ncbi:MAG: 3-phosphoshikimate 1-carboxyvinyltransferase [Armatimonadetes bacterium]|jgi:3-phosphoshikimate 1-carboxyvinyltransferase|nr:3-phosphoshikimate 1-carboxyvinyltransferase [Armatimonadota bacterium]